MTTSERSAGTGKEFTGRKMLILTVSAFAVIIGVNVVMAFKAISTFPGLEVDNAYVASQTFDAERRAQEALGWTAGVEADGETFRLTLIDSDGNAVRPESLSVMIGRSTERNDDQTPELIFDGEAWTAPVELAGGYWQVWLKAVAADGTAFRQRLDLTVRG
ncbi:FixH family protein [Frigidibacter sp. ROC022]|uniref:FixH family protein n=1 Tax=Frigidibacter sp. ROC022 TaxID=2971796 RepID=UPI00215AD3D9|nr:FixH family protein [Frigidibacter sp. ROC022]MCR8724212.1 FixH family protein [Frigidibacter sp. ROC022]